jgi:hypothetical protein
MPESCFMARKKKPKKSKKKTRNRVPLKILKKRREYLTKLIEKRKNEE